MTGKVYRLARSYNVRAADFISLLDHQIAASSSADRSGVPRALKLIKTLVEDAQSAIRAKVEAVSDDPEYAEDAGGEVQGALNVLLSQIESHDAHFARSSRSISPAIRFLVRREASEWEQEPGSVIVSIGQPKTYLTVEPAFSQSHTPTQEERILAISVPQIGGGKASWLPIVLGHELAHYLLAHVEMNGLKDLREEINGSIDEALIESEVEPRVRRSGHDSGASARTSGQENPTPGLTAKQVAREWLDELICDAYSIAKFGPAGFAALAEHLGALGDPGRAPSTFSHPPSTFRVGLMRSWLGSPRELGKRDSLLVSRFDDLLIESPSDSPAVDHLIEVITPLADTVWNLTVSWMRTPPFWEALREDEVEQLAKLIADGCPPSQVTRESAVEWAEPTVILNAAWRASLDLELEHPTDQLAMKALEDFHFVETWSKAEGDATPPPAPLEAFDRVVGEGVLAYTALNERLSANNSKRRLTLTPLLPGAVGDSSIDIRLGNQFIVFDRTAYPAFDSLSNDRPDPRSMQHKIAKAWGEVFYLHPGQLVLAAALEYLMMPEDLSAQVVTRSSFGRLGLISATAVQVHPGYQGCLTLELVNLGETPIAITPGERIAQLMFFHTTGSPSSREPRYRFPVGPEFSKVSEDGEWKVLHRMRQSTRA